MLKGTLFALGACFIWGLIFIVPQFMSHFSPVEVALGRYTCYGLLSSLIFLRLRVKGSCKYPLPIWLKAMVFSFASTFGYYIFVILALRFASAAICALILGICPIVTAFYGNWKEREFSFKKLIAPSILILVGLIIINAPHFNDNPSSSLYAAGLLCSLGALAAWSWYVVANAGFLKRNPQIALSEWATMIGVASMVWSLFFGALSWLIFGSEIESGRYSLQNPHFIPFLMGAAILGLLCSWVGGFFWNKASFHLPISLAGQLTIFETIFGLVFVWILEKTLPPVWEGIGIFLLLTAIVYGIRLTSSPAVEQKADEA
jgi:drug/metabolite transporter (DMT)-like permease